VHQGGLGLSPRIVSLAPSATSILCAVGAKNTLVGVTKWCADVAPVGGLPQLGDCWYLGSVDEIVRLRPTLVIGSVPYKGETVARLLERPLNFLAMNPRTLNDIDSDIRMLGSLVNRRAAAERVVGKMRRTLAAAAKVACRVKPRVRVYCEAWPNPRTSSPPWVAELLPMVGGEMVVPSGSRVTDEQVRAADPELIVLAWAATGDRSSPRRAYQVPAWKDVAAVRQGQVHVIRDEFLNTPGPPLMQGIQELARLIPKVRLES